MIMDIHKVSLFAAILIVLFISGSEGGIGEQLLEILKRFIQSECKCAPYLCCSKWGYCGLTKAYCGVGCQSGPCSNKSRKIPDSFTVTPEIFQCVFPNIDTNVRTRRFHGLMKAMIQLKWKPSNAVEAAIFLAHIAYETDGLNRLAEDCIARDTCDNYQTSWCSIGPNPDRKYYGRGMLHLTYPCQYYEAGQALGLDLLNNPDLVSQSDKVAAATAIWYYKQTGMHELAQQGHFGGTTRRLNKYQCASKQGYAIHLTRVNVYQKVRSCFALPEATTHLTC